MASQKLSIFVYLVIIPLASVGSCIWYQGHKKQVAADKNKAAAEAEAQYVATPQGYRQRHVECSFQLDLDSKGKVYLKGKIRNTGSRPLKDIVVIFKPTAANVGTPPPLHIGQIGPKTEKAISRHIDTQPGRYYVEYSWHVKDVVLGKQ